MVQAVPSAKYTPCIDELRLGWDSVEFFARRGEAGIRIIETINPFLTATVTESCDVSGAVQVDSGRSDIARYEDVEFESAAITIVIVPSGDRTMVAAQALKNRFSDEEVNDRPVNLIVDERMDEPVTDRVNRALERDRYVWIVGALDAEEGTVEMRSNDPVIAGRGLKPNDAIEVIEDGVPGLFYRGKWYFTFEGGCITYEFDAKGILAESVAVDAEDALGFYPAFELRRIGEDAGFEFE
jgi:hypothetical protein